MWLFCRSGFFSAVKHAKKRGVIHVRARFRGDLERLCGNHGIAPVVTETPFNDYRFRMDFKRREWSRIVREEAEAIDYGNFKDMAHDGTDRDGAYMGAWWAMRDGQEHALGNGHGIPW